MTEWTDLDQAYLEAWGEHPDLSTGRARLALMRHNVTVHAPADRPDVEVLVDARWLVGEVRQQWQEGEVWLVEVQYRRPGTHSRTIDTFPLERVRNDETDYSVGRV